MLSRNTLRVFSGTILLPILVHQVVMPIISIVHVAIALDHYQHRTFLIFKKFKKFKKGVGITIKSKETSGKLAIQL